MHFEIYRTNNEYAFQLLDENEQLMLTSGLYSTVEACVQGIRLFAEAAVHAKAYTLLSDDRACSFIVQSNGKQLAQSIGYPSEDDAKEATELLREELADTTNYEVTYTEVRSQTVQRPGLLVDIDSYAFDQVSSSGQMGFEAFQQPDTKLYYFHFNDHKGKAFLYSQAYTAENTRDNGIRSVIQNAAKDNRYEIREEKGLYYFILKAINGREVARSRMFDNRNEMENHILLLKTQAGTFAEDYKKPEKVRTRGGNPPVDKYNFELASQSGKEGFEVLQDQSNRQHYFHFNNDRAEAILYSQGYNNVAGRDNGIRSVIKNAYLEERYQRMQQQGSYYFILKAGNNQEIARSPRFETAADMEIAIQYLKSHASAYAQTYQLELRAEEVQSQESRTFNVQVNRLEPVAVPASVRQIDQYDFTQKSSTGKAGFEAFYSESNQAYYFHFNDDQGNAILYSESYPNDIVRDNGIESVKKNAPLENRWKIVEENGRYYYTLKAANNQEIARGPLFETKAQAQAKLVFIQANSTQTHLMPTTTLTESSTLLAAGAATALSADSGPPASAVVPPVARNTTFGPIPSDAGAVYIDPLQATPGGAPLQKFIITSVPLAAQGLLYLHEKPIEKFQEIPLTDSSKLQFQPNEDTTGDIFFRYKAIDKANVHSEEADYRIRVERAQIPVAAYAPPVASHTIPGTSYTTSTEESSRTGWLIAAAAIAAIALVGYWWNNRTPQPNEIIPQGNTAEVSTTLPQTAAASVTPVATPEAAIENFQPIRLYFNNDHPNPRTQAETTPLTYQQTYQSYYTQKERFEQQYTKGLTASDASNARQRVENFFTNQVKKGYDDLVVLSDKLLEKLKADNVVEITVTGYASPLADSEYNKKLTSRRVNTIENHFRTYKNGQFVPYLEKGMLLITEKMSGEEAASPATSDNQADTRSSLYSPDASAERRVEITQVTIRKPD